MKKLYLYLFIIWAIVGAVLFGPFLIQRMQEAHAFTVIAPRVRTFYATNFPQAKCDEADGVSPMASNGACSLIDTGLAHAHGVLFRVSAQTVDTGDASGGLPNFSNWAGADAAVYNFALFAGNGNNITNITTAAGTATATFAASSPFPASTIAGVGYCISGGTISGTQCFPSTGAHYSGAGCATIVSPCNVATLTWAQGGTPASPCTVGAPCQIVFACGFALTGAWAPCDIVPIIQHHRGGSVQNMPDYIFAQLWGNTASNVAWAANTPCNYRTSIKVGANYYHNTSLTSSTGIGTTSGTIPSFNATLHSNTPDNTCTWFNDGTNALPQESVAGAGYPGDSLGVVNTSSSGNAVTLVSGSNFQTGGVWSGTTIVINGAIFTISSVASSSSLSLTTSPGTQTSVTYTVGNAPPQANYATGGAVYNINSAVGSSVGNCFPAACTPDDVGLGFPIFGETPYQAWYNIFNTTLNDGHGNLGAIPHYAAVPWVSQLAYIRFGGFDNGEWFGFLETVVVSASWFNLTYAQYQGIYIDGYADNIYTALASSWNAAAPPWQLDTATNCFANGPAQGKCQAYPAELIARANAHLLGYGFGNQGWSAADLQTEAQGLWATTATGFIYPMFDQFAQLFQLNGRPRHLQFIAPTCPANGNQSHCVAGNSGSFAQFEPLGTQHGVHDTEWFAQDMSIIFDSRYLYAADGCAYTICVTAGPDYLDAQADNYQSYFGSMLLGLPSSTSGQGGTGRVGGSTQSN